MPNPSAQLTIGDRLRSARERRGLTLDQLAEVSAVSKAHLSRMESGDRQPSVSTLLELSAALGVRVSTLLGEDQGRSALSVHGPDEPRLSSGGLSIASSSGFEDSRALEALRITVQPHRPATPPAQHRGEELLYVVTGTLTLEYDGQLYDLPPGTSAHFDAERPHRLTASGGTVEVLLVSAQESSSLGSLHR